MGSTARNSPAGAASVGFTYGLDGAAKARGDVASCCCAAVSMAGCADWRRRWRCCADRCEAAACRPMPLWFSSWSGERSRSSESKGSGKDGAGLARLLEAEPAVLADEGLTGETGGRLAEPEREPEGMSAEARARFSGDEAGLRGSESRRSGIDGWLCESRGAAGEAKADEGDGLVGLEAEFEERCLREDLDRNFGSTILPWLSIRSSPPLIFTCDSGMWDARVGWRRFCLVHLDRDGGGVKGQTRPGTFARSPREMQRRELDVRTIRGEEFSRWLRFLVWIEADGRQASFLLLLVFARLPQPSMSDQR